MKQITLNKNREQVIPSYYERLLVTILLFRYIHPKNQLFSRTIKLTDNSAPEIASQRARGNLHFILFFFVIFANLSLV